MDPLQTRLDRAEAHAQQFLDRQDGEELSVGPPALAHLEAALAEALPALDELPDGERRRSLARDVAGMLFVRGISPAGRPDDLDRAEQLTLTADQDDETADLLGHLRLVRGARRLEHFQTDGRAADLDAAVADLTLARETLSHQADPETWLLAVTGLAGALQTRAGFQQSPHAAALLAACLTDWLDATPEGDPDRPGVVLTYALTLLQQVIGLGRWLPELDPLLPRLPALLDPDEETAAFAFVVGCLYALRFLTGLSEGTGDVADAHEAEGRLEESIAAGIPEPKLLAQALGLLGMVMRTRVISESGWRQHAVMDPVKDLAGIIADPDFVRAGELFRRSSAIDRDALGGWAVAVSADLTGPFESLAGDRSSPEAARIAPILAIQEAERITQTLGHDPDGAMLDPVIARLRRELGDLRPGEPGHAPLTFSLGTALVLRGQRDRSAADVRVGLVHLRAAVLELEGDDIAEMLALGERLLAELAAETPRRPGHGPVEALDRRLALLDTTHPTRATAEQLTSLAFGYHAHGERDQATRVGLRAVREFTSAVLVLDDAEERIQLARRGNEVAGLVARRHLAFRDARGAIDALEAGRGLTLYATTFTLGVSELLRRSGQEDLVRAWEAVGEDPAARARALNAVFRSAAGVTAMQPVPLQQIHHALWASELDALVYLIAGDGEHRGHAVVVRDRLAIQVVPLRGLRLLPGGPVTTLRTAQRQAFAADATGADVIAWRTAMTAFSIWAHDAALEPVLAALPPHPRIGLVPIGELSAAPWHAAARVVPGGVRYVIQDAVISYAPSARQLSEAVSRPAPPLRQRPVIVANPTGDLHWAEVAGLAVRDAFYPDGLTVGTRAEVLAQLPSGSADGASLLQLSTHATAVPGSVDSRFLLAAGESLTVGQILDHARGRRPDAPGGLVICDSCLTDVTEDDHDEVLTLGTAFLAAGATTVIGAKWPLQDHVAAVMSFMLHHFLATGRRPVDALNRTQLWMLDPARPVPPEMPEALRDIARSRGLARIEAWGGLIHQGK